MVLRTTRVHAVSDNRKRRNPHERTRRRLLLVIPAYGSGAHSSARHSVHTFAVSDVRKRRKPNQIESGSMIEYWKYKNPHERPRRRLLLVIPAYGSRAHSSTRHSVHTFAVSYVRKRRKPNQIESGSMIEYWKYKNPHERPRRRLLLVIPAYGSRAHSSTRDSVHTFAVTGPKLVNYR